MTERKEMTWQRYEEGTGDPLKRTIAEMHHQSFLHAPVPPFLARLVEDDMERIQQMVRREVHNAIFGTSEHEDDASVQDDEERIEPHIVTIQGKREDTSQKFAHLAQQIVSASEINLETIYEEQALQRCIARGIYDAISQTLTQVTPAFEQTEHGTVNIDWESIMSVIDIPTLREGWDKD